MITHHANDKLGKTTYMRGVANIHQWMNEEPLSDEEAQRRLDQGDKKKKIVKKLRSSKYRRLHSLKIRGKT